MKRAMERNEREEAHIIPVILRPVYWQSAPFGQLQALPRDGKSVSSWELYHLDEAFFDIAEGMRCTVLRSGQHAILVKASGSFALSKEYP